MTGQLRQKCGLSEGFVANTLHFFWLPKLYWGFRIGKVVGMSFKGRHSFGMSSSRKPWGKDDKAKHGKHSAALIESRNNLTGGGRF